MTIPENLFKDLFLRDKTELSNAVRTISGTAEKEMLPKMAEALVKWAGAQLWLQSYDLKDFELFKRNYDYGKGLGLGMTMDINNMPITVRRFCYEYVALAECIRKENERLRSFWLYRLIGLFRKRPSPPATSGDKLKRAE
ncbi:hypothetical protein LCGC14_0390380 [marine sediment metagenome]|uniref:Uncharacterized protein n=1 Tax=marine sediment metagenome TaxID=412755 RepID=A0A0F9W8N5_9ZZZZ